MLDQLPSKHSEALMLMIERKALVRLDTPEAEDEADSILEQVKRLGGLTTDEVYELMGH